MKDLTKEKGGKSTEIHDKPGKCLIDEHTIRDRWRTIWNLIVTKLMDTLQY